MITPSAGNGGKRSDVSAKQKIEFRCDLCKYPATILDSEQAAQDAGWLKIGHESYYEDRAFYESHICPECAKTLRAVMQKQIDRELNKEFAERTK